MNLDLNKLPDNPMLLKHMLIDLSVDYNNTRTQLSDITTILFNTKSNFLTAQSELSNTENKLTDTETKLSDTQKDLKEVKLKNEFLETKVAFLNYRLFGKKSESIEIGLKEKGQLFLFDEAEIYSSFLKARE